MRPTPQKHNTRKGKVTDFAAALTRMTALAMILTLIPVPMNVSAIEEQDAIERKVEPESEVATGEKEALRETKKETGVVNIAVPAKYTVELNPYELADGTEKTAKVQLKIQ